MSATFFDALESLVEEVNYGIATLGREFCKFTLSPMEALLESHVQHILKHGSGTDHDKHEAMLQKCRVAVTQVQSLIPVSHVLDNVAKSVNEAIRRHQSSASNSCISDTLQTWTPQPSSDLKLREAWKNCKGKVIVDDAMIAVVTTQWDNVVEEMLRTGTTSLNEAGKKNLLFYAEVLSNLVPLEKTSYFEFDQGDEG